MDNLKTMLDNTFVDEIFAIVYGFYIFSRLYTR